MRLGFVSMHDGYLFDVPEEQEAVGHDIWRFRITEEADRRQDIGIQGPLLVQHVTPQQHRTLLSSFHASF
jgi:hypothetical protein